MSFADPLSRLAMRTLASLPSPVEQLIYLASLRDMYTGRYLHEGWATLGTPAEVNRLLRLLHTQVFTSVVELRLEALSRVLRDHFRSLGESVEEMAEIWLENEPYREMLPHKCSPVERCLFISQMRAGLGVLRGSPDLAVLGEPAASPPPQFGPPPPLDQVN